jgi:hypothetical protein
MKTNKQSSSADQTWAQRKLAALVKRLTALLSRGVVL